MIVWDVIRSLTDMQLKRYPVSMTIFVVFSTVGFTVTGHIEPGWILMEIKVDVCGFRRFG